MSYFFGIDFGTTNSAVYAINATNERIDDEFTIGEDTRRPLPSYVAIHKHTGEVMTGLDAKSSISDIDEYEVFPSIKSVIDEDKEWVIASRKWTPVDIAAELFKALADHVYRQTRTPLNEAVVAVPIGFSSKKKNCIRQAAKSAGVDVKMFVSEPTAAFCGRKRELRKYHNVVVFDWGGGTLDVVVLRIEDGVIKELASNGIPVAGNNIDKRLAERVCMNASKKSGIDYSFDDLSERDKHRILLKCEQAKCKLADEDIVTIADANLGKYGGAFEKIDSYYFELLIEDEVNQAVSCLLNTIAEAGLNRESIDCILCEGGSSRLRPLQARLKKYFDVEQLIFPRKAMWDIAAGVAEISYKPGCYMLNRPIGLMQSNNVFYPLLDVGQRIPTEEKTVRFGLVDSVGEARFVMTDGNTEDTQTFTEEYQVKLRGFDDEYIEVSCYVDADMIFKMKVHSNRMPDDVYRVWTYSKLKVSYEMDAPEPVRNSK